MLEFTIIYILLTIEHNRDVAPENCNLTVVLSRFSPKNVVVGRQFETPALVVVHHLALPEPTTCLFCRLRLFQFIRLQFF